MYLCDVLFCFVIMIAMKKTFFTLSVAEILLIVLGLYVFILAPRFENTQHQTLETSEVHSTDRVLGDRYSPLVVVVYVDTQRPQPALDLIEALHLRYDEDIALVQRTGPEQSLFIQGRAIDFDISITNISRIIDQEMRELEARKGGEKTHTHADIKIFLNRVPLDLSGEKYQSTPEKPLHPDIHLHDGNGEMIHLHWTGVTIDRFFTSLGMYLDKDCLVLDDGREYCTGVEGTLSIYADDKPVGPDYLVEDLDRLLVSFGDPADIPQQLLAVKDEACVYSLLCPERGTPPTESCVGGVDSACGVY